MSIILTSDNEKSDAVVVVPSATLREMVAISPNRATPMPPPSTSIIFMVPGVELVAGVYFALVPVPPGVNVPDSVTEPEASTLATTVAGVTFAGSFNVNSAAPIDVAAGSVPLRVILSLAVPAVPMPFDVVLLVAVVVEPALVVVVLVVTNFAPDNG